MPNNQAALNFPFWLANKNQWQIWDDFDHYVTADTWTTTASDSGTIAVSDAAAGVVILSPSDGSVVLDDEVYMKSTTEIFLVGSGAHLYAEFRVKVIEAATNVATFFVGFCSAIAANTLTDGGGIRATGDLFAVYKQSGDLYWRTIACCNGTATKTQTNQTLVSNTYYNVRVEVRAVDGTNVEATFFVNDQPLRDSNNKAIKTLVAFASATEMQVGAGVKNGANTTHDKIYLDYVYAGQTPRPSA